MYHSMVFPDEVAVKFTAEPWQTELGDAEVDVGEAGSVFTVTVLVLITIGSGSPVLYNVQLIV